MWGEGGGGGGGAMRQGDFLREEIGILVDELQLVKLNLLSLCMCLVYVCNYKNNN